MAGRLEQMIRSRRMRILAVALLSAAGVWSFAPYVMNRVATEAAINAPLVRIHAPIDGTVGALPAVGQYLGEPTRIELIRLASDAGALGEAMAEAAEAEATAAMARRQIAELRAEEARLEARAGLFRRAAIATLEAEQSGIRAEQASCSAARGEAAANLARAEQLAERGFISAAGLERARAEAVETRSRCEAAVATAGALSSQRRAAASGVLMGDGSNDQPYSAQQRDRLQLRRQELEALLLAADARAAGARRRLEEAHARANPTLPAGLFVWDVAASPGTAAAAGTTLLDLADCRRRFVDVALPERAAEAIAPGDSARVRLVGTSRWVVGNVVRITGSAARDDGLLYAAERQAKPGAREIRVEVALPFDGTTPDNSRRCEIGRLAEVRFARTPLG